MTAQQNILLVTSRPAQFKEFTQALCSHSGMAAVTVGTAKDATVAVKEIQPVLAIVDDQVCGVAGFDIIRRLMEVNAFIQTAVISDLSDQDFHNRSEGLGILSKLPLVPDKADAERLITQLENVSANFV